MADSARQEAALADAQLARGLDRGPLHGIPYGLKDIIAVPGAPTTWGAAPFADQVLSYESAVGERLRDAGAVLLGKLATVELAGGMGYTDPDASLTGPALNPWDTRTWTGGSSSGPAAATAAGAVPFSIGSDTGGSIVMPAAWTGITGLRATHGRVSRRGAMALSWSFDRLGPMCRSAADCGLVLEAIAGHDPRDPSSLREPYRYRGLPAAAAASASAWWPAPPTGCRTRSGPTSSAPSPSSASWAPSRKSRCRTSPTPRWPTSSWAPRSPRRSTSSSTRGGPAS